MQPPPQAPRLLNFNRAVLAQALELLDCCAAHPEVRYADFVGPHLRHVVEHYDAFVTQLEARTIDYDARPRDPDVEQDPQVARARIGAVTAALDALSRTGLKNPLAIHLLGGLEGDEHFVTFSSAERELMFLASHAIHHYAQIKLHLAALGIGLNPDFGKAPATVHHEHSR